MSFVCKKDPCPQGTRDLEGCQLVRISPEFSTLPDFLP